MAPEHTVAPACCLSSLHEDSSDEEVRLEVRRLLGTAIVSLNELAELAMVSTWEVDEGTIQAIVDYRPS